MAGNRIAFLCFPGHCRDQPRLHRHPDRDHLFIGCCLQIFGFAAGAALLVALLLSLLTGGALRSAGALMLQVESGNFKAVDFDNFDEFF